MFCREAAGILQVIGWIVTIFKIAIPLIIIVLGMFDFGKAVVSGKDEDIKEQAKKIGLRIFAGIIIFFVPTIVMAIFNLAIGEEKYAEGDKGDVNFKVCEACILKPWTADCDSRFWEDK